jgi:multidrug efflux pump
VLATGPGAGARNSIGIMLVSGMIVGTAFTLFVVPSIYLLVARDRVAAFSTDQPARADRSAHLPSVHPVPVGAIGGSARSAQEAPNA